MFILRQTSVKMAVLLHKQAKVPFILIIAVCKLLASHGNQIYTSPMQVICVFLFNFSHGLETDCLFSLIKTDKHVQIKQLS